ncbi:MAG: MarR family transcriptional regulator [Bowdeniella nasicola]|nr:MarR family transcriptional regulator [Bowdeniella nasicola]
MHTTLNPLVGTPYGPQEDDLTSTVRVAVHRTARRLRHEAQAAADLTQTQFCVLSSLDRLGPMTPGELADHEQVQPPSMTRTLAGLQAADYIARGSHPRDRRQVLVSLTDEGSQVLTKVRRRRTAWLAEALAELEPDDREVMRRAADLLLAMVDR